MFTRTIAAVDGREGGRDAAVLAAALRGSGELVLAHVQRRAGHHRFAQPNREAGARERALALLAAEARTCEVEARFEVLGADAPGEGLAWLAAHLEADLLVLGSPHRGATGRVLAADIVRDALRHAPCAVAVAPRDLRAKPRGPIATIGLGYDGTPEGERAMAVAAGLARELDARLRVLAVVEPAEGTSPARRDRMARHLEHACGRLAPGCETRIVVSDPPAELERFSHQVDLLCLGERERTRTERLLSGGVSEHVAEHAACPVLVVPWRVPAPEAARPRRSVA